MKTTKHQKQEVEVPQPEKYSEINKPAAPEAPDLPAENPNFVPFEKPFEVPPYEAPQQSEGFN